MHDEQDWDDPWDFLAEQTRTIRRELAIFVVPVLLLAVACGAWGLASRDKSQLAAQTAPASIIDRR